MADCNYRFKDAGGAEVVITGRAAMKAAMVQGRLDHLMPELKSLTKPMRQTGTEGEKDGQAVESRSNAEVAAQGGAPGRADVGRGAGDLVQRPDGAAGTGVGAAAASAERRGAPAESAGAAGGGRGAVGRTVTSQSGANQDAPADEALRVQAAIEGKGLLEAARFMTQSADPARAEVAGAVLNKLERLRAAGVTLGLTIAHRGDMVPAPLHNGRGYTETGFDEKGRDIAVWLNGADVAGKVGTDEETLLHELVHAATTGMVFYGQQNPSTQAGQHVRDLMAVTDAIAAHISQRFADADAGKVALTEFEKDMREGANNAFRNDDEVLAWALSSRDAQTYLEGIPYKAGTLWARFVSAVRNLLGLPAQADTALSEVLRVADRLMTDDAPQAGRAAFWHKRGMQMVQQQGKGSIVQARQSTADARRSAAADQAADGVTAESLPGIFAERFPKLTGAVRTMLDRGALGQKGGLVVLDSNDEATIAREFADRTGRSFDDTVQLFAGAGEDINAFYDPASGQTFLIGPNLSAETLPAVVLHEMVHGQQRKALDQKSLALIESRDSEAPKLRAFLDRVAERMDTVGEADNPFEASSYIVEMAVTEGRQAGFSAADGPILAWIERNIGRKVADLVRDFVATVRAWALAHGVELKRIAVDDLVAYAMVGVGKAAQGRVVTVGGNSGSMKSMSERQGVAGKQAPTPAGDVEAGGAEPRYTSRNWREWYELPRFQSDDDSTVLFNHGHGGYIQRVEDRKPGVFDGIFALRDPGMTERGPDVTAFRIPNDKMLSQRDLEYDLDYNTVSTALADVLPRKIEAGSDRFDSVWSAVVEDSSDFEQLGLEEDGSVREDSFMDIFGYDAEDAGEASWFAQKLRGRLAQKLGYQAVEMDDENGTSWYIVPGVESIPLNEPSASAGPDAPGISFSRAGIANRVRAAAAQVAQPSRKSSLGDLSAQQQAAVEHVFGKPKTWRERAEAFAKDWQKNLVQGVFDQFAPIKEISAKGYMQARLAKGGDSTLEAMLMYGKVSVDKDGVYQVDFDGQNLNGFAKTLAKLDGEHDRFLAWVSGLRAERLSGVGLENLMTPADISGLKSMADGTTKSGKVRSALYGQALKELNEWNDSVLKIAEDSGLIDEATRKMYQDTPYVPFYRLSDEDVIQGPSVSKGLVNQSAWKQLKGGTNQLNEDLMGNLLKNWSHLITASANNRAAKEILDTAAKMGAATDVTNDVVAQDINGQPVARGSTKGLVRYRGEIVRKIPQGQPYLENGQAKVSDGTAEVKYIGERYFRVDDPHLMDAVASIGFTPKVWKPMADFKRYLTFGVTVNPTFKIRNLIRDSIQAVGTADLSYNPVQNILMGAKGTAMMSNVRAQMLASGGMLRFGSAEGGYSGHVRRLIEKGVDPQYILDDENKLKAFWKHKILPAFEAYQELGDRSENVNRAALYEQLLAKGMSHAEASFWARDMMDFSLHGKWAAVRTLTSVVPFMNARLQGIYKLGRATKADYRRMGATLAAVSIASIGLMLAYGDDDDWKKREDWDRDNSWWFKVGDTAYRIPKPFEIGAIGTIAERSLELMISDEMTGKRFGQRMRDLVMQNLSMNPTPQLVKPMIDLYANKDAFSGRDIETQGMEKMRPEDRYTARTSEVARFLGQIGLPNPAQLIMGRWEGLSPVQVDYLIRGYFSWLGTSATSVLDRGIRPMMDRGEQPAMRLRDTFLVGNFVESLPAGSSRYVTQFYDQAKEIEQMYASYQQALKEGDTTKAQEIQADNPEAFAARRRIEAAKRGQSLISGQMRAIERDKVMSSEEKRKRLELLETQRDQIARRALMVPAAAGRD